MKHLFTFTFVLFFLAGCSDSSTLTSALEEDSDTPLARSGQNKTEVCHLDANTGAFSLISIADPAFDAHQAHGDGVPGEAVPGQNGYVFDAGCVPQLIYTFIDFEEASDRVGDSGTTNAAYVGRDDVINGFNVTNIMSLFDTSEVPGYGWEVNNVDFDSPGLRCVYPLVSLRARVEFEGSVERVDFDGYEVNPYGYLTNSWDLANGDRPTLIVESMIIDQNARTCS